MNKTSAGSGIADSTSRRRRRVRDLHLRSYPLQLLALKIKLPRECLNECVANAKRQRAGIRIAPVEPAVSEEEHVGYERIRGTNNPVRLPVRC